MITLETTLANGHRARGFFRQFPDVPAAEAMVVERYWDEEDQAREPVLRSVLARLNVAAIAYPTLEHRDVLQVFLRDDDAGDLVFACVLVTGARLRAMLAQSSPVVEGFTLQVLPSEHLSMEGVRAALQSWIERCFPGVGLPNLTVERWTGPDGILYEVLALLLSHPEHAAAAAEIESEASEELRPDPSIAQPPYEVAA
jgi:hypothetical protein